MPKWQRALICLFAVTFTCVFFINFCNLIFQCGCTFLWSGAADHCNIHHGPKRCPWCTIGLGGQMGVWLAMVIPQAVVSFWPSQWGWPLRLFLATVTFPIAGVVLGISLGLRQGYWN